MLSDEQIIKSIHVLGLKLFIHQNEQTTIIKYIQFNIYIQFKSRKNIYT